MNHEQLSARSKEIADQISQRLRAIVPVSSGKLRDSIEAKVDEQGNLIDIIIDGESYYKFLDEGRLAGTFPPLAEIETWAKKRGIEPKKAFAIAVSIEKKGIKPRNLSAELEREMPLGDPEGLDEAFGRDVEAELKAVMNKLFA